MSQMLDYPREVPAMWLDLAHVIAGAAPSRQGAVRAEFPAYEEMNAPASAARRHWLAGVQYFAVAFVSALACLAWPNSTWVIQSLRH